MRARRAIALGEEGLSLKRDTRALSALAEIYDRQLDELAKALALGLEEPACEQGPLSPIRQRQGGASAAT